MYKTHMSRSNFSNMTNPVLARSLALSLSSSLSLPFVDNCPYIFRYMHAYTPLYIHKYMKIQIYIGISLLT